MRTSLLALLVFAALASSARATPPEPPTAPLAGLPRKLEVETLPATMPKSRMTHDVFATVKVTGEVGAD
ncbi:MAG TPA: hypothetical protein VFF73_31675 [Planctomycetota bacterium]|nr:hypothetical protein [Planctomycetota bacterium]